MDLIHGLDQWIRSKDQTPGVNKVGRRPRSFLAVSLMTQKGRVNKFLPATPGRGRGELYEQLTNGGIQTGGYEKGENLK